MVGNLDISWTDLMGVLDQRNRPEAPPKPKPKQQPRPDRAPPQEFVEPEGLPPNWDLYNFTYGQEVGAKSGQPHVPSDKSGVTIGPGFDLSQRDPQQAAKELISIGIPKNQAETLAKGAGLKGKEAREFIKDKDIKISPDQEARLFLRNVPEYEGRAIKDLKDMGYDVSWNDLDPEQKSLLFDYTYNLGGLKDFQKFTDAVLDRDWNRALKHHKRYSGDQPLGKRNKDTRKMLANLKEGDFTAPPQDLSKQEKNVIKHHRDNLRRNKYVHDDRGLSTAYMRALRGPDNKLYSVPSVIDGERRTPEETAEYAQSVGWESFPSFTNERQMQKSMQKMQRTMEKDLSDFIQKARRVKKGGAAQRRRGINSGKQNSNQQTSQQG